MTIKLVNNLTKTQTILSQLSDKFTSKLFYDIDIVLPEGMDDGEYTYTLFDGDTELACGLLQIGDYTPQKEVYENNNTYITYKG